MAKYDMLVVLAIVMTIMSTMCVVSKAQSSTSGCTNVLVSLSPCLGYLTGNSSTPPASGCCSQLASVVQNEPQCLCQVINGGGSSSMASSLNINQTQALALPTACKLSTPPISRCKSGAASPSGSTTSQETPTSTGGGSKATPTPQGDASNANKSKLSVIALPLFWAFIFIGSNALAQ